MKQLLLVACLKIGSKKISKGDFVTVTGKVTEVEMGYAGSYMIDVRDADIE